MTPDELRIHRNNTVWFISHRPSEIVLTPRSKVDTAGGGFRLEDGTPRDPQTMRIIELGSLATPPVVVLTNGKQRTVQYWLLGAYDAQMEIGDYWEADGKMWEVGHVVRDNGYEVRGLVAERGD